MRRLLTDQEEAVTEAFLMTATPFSTRFGGCEREPGEVRRAGMAGPTVALFGREDPARIDFVVETLKERGPSVRGEFAGVLLGVEAMGGEPGSKGPLRG